MSASMGREIQGAAAERLGGRRVGDMRTPLPCLNVFGGLAVAPAFARPARHVRCRGTVGGAVGGAPTGSPSPEKR
ncbi:hypothetical protein AB5J52_08985 [Streptomyces sp. R39]|uniref:Uncharacterized protein n=1 Tax=Streptomyces sp. R39 TaxID=3238631 RepID=A0AB39QJ50_9ACTN